MTKTNCSECMGDRHENCLDPENCLCADPEYNHGVRPVTIEDMFANEKQYLKPANEPREYEAALKDEEELDRLLDDGMEDSGDTINRAVEIIDLSISVRHTISKIQVKEIVSNWSRRFGIVFGLPIDKIIEVAWNEPRIFTNVKSIAYQIGMRRQKIMFAQGQFTEVAYYLMGRYHIKRIELTGNLIFFNDEYYEKNAEALIRRNGRKILIKSKNGDMNEIVKMIEDLCKLITWKDIEDSIHIKCLLNGVYNIKTGIFSPEFSPDNIILNQLPHHYVTSGDFVNINSKVKDIINNDQDRQSYYDSLSTALHPYSGIDFQFGGIGPPGTGKSQICELSILTLGGDNVSSATIHLIANDLTTQKDVAFNFLNIDMDMSNETMRNIDVLKRWITQDPFTARGIYEHNTTFRPMARICFMANDLYEIANSDDADAIYERTHVIPITTKFRGQPNVIRNVFKTVATESELNEFVSYLLRNAVWIWDNQKIHHPINISTVRDTWNLHGNRIKEFSESWLEKGVEFRVDQVEVWNRWLSFSNMKNYPAKDKKKFHQIFDEIIGNSPSKTRLGTGDNSRQVYAYSGFRLLRDEEIAQRETIAINMTNETNKIDEEISEKDSGIHQSLQNIFRASDDQSSKSSVLSLLNIIKSSESRKLIEEKLVELSELIDYSRGKRS